MAFNPYTPVTVTGYNANPPPDDGSDVPQNEIVWAGIKEKLGDPVKDAVDQGLDSGGNVEAAFAKRYLNSITTQGSSRGIGIEENGRLIKASGTGTTLTLPDASAAQAGWQVTVKNVGGQDIVVAALGGQQVDGQQSITLGALNDHADFVCDGAGYTSLGSFAAAGASVGEIRGYTGLTTPPAEWLRANGDTLGNTVSGATHQGEAFRALFNHLNVPAWGNPGGADFDAGDTVFLPRMDDRFLVGGGISHSLGASGGAHTRDIASAIQVDEHTLTVSELPAHTHDPGTLATSDGAHKHSMNFASGAGSPHRHTIGTMTITLESGHTHGAGTYFATNEL